MFHVVCLYILLYVSVRLILYVVFYIVLVYSVQWNDSGSLHTHTHTHAEGGIIYTAEYIYGVINTSVYMKHLVLE